MVRAGLRQVEELHPQLRVVGEASNGLAAINETQRLHPNVVLLDHRLPDLNGHEVCRRIKADHPETRILFLSSFADATTVNAALDAGADGYLLKENDAQKIVDGIIAVHRGGLVVDPAIARVTLGQNHPSTKTPPSVLETLSDQERRVLLELAAGKRDKEIAATLHLEPKTVRNYLAHIYRKIGVTSRTQAVLWFHQQPQASNKQAP